MQAKRGNGGCRTPSAQLEEYLSDDGFIGVKY